MSDDPKRFMSLLPEKPSFERQQKLAKRLLRELWAGQTDAVERFNALHPAPPAVDHAKLSDAQLVIARGYGFRKWSDLKRKIDSLMQSPFEQLAAAVRSGDIEHVRALFERYPELNQQVNDSDGTFGASLVFHARTQLPLLDLLIEHGADVNRKSDWAPGGFGLAEDQPVEVVLPLLERGVSEDIWVAVRIEHFARVRQLLDADPSLVNARGGDGKQPLHYAQSPAMVDLLIQRGADVDARDIDHTSTPLQYLVRNKPVARRLLDHGASPDIFLAAALGDQVLIERCLAEAPACVTHRLGVEPWINDEGGVIYNWTLGHGKTPLDVAVDFGHAESHRLMLEACPPKTRFMDSAWRGDVAAGRALLDQCPGLLESMSDDDHAALNRACWWYRPEAVTAMLALGFDRHIQDNEKMTPLDRAAFHGHAECLEALLQGDPDPPLAWKNQYGGTPLEACIHGALHGWSTGHAQNHARCVSLLLDTGAGFESSWFPTGHGKIDAVFRDRM